MELGTGVKRSQYSILPDQDSISPSHSRSWSLFTRPLRLPRSTLIAVLFLLTSAISAIGGYLAGKQLALGETKSLIILNQVPVTFEYEFNYAEAPSNLTNQRWESLFPLNGGFFQHPDVGPDPVAFSVFHQLHCLDGIRHAYWTMRNRNHSEEGHSGEEHSEEGHPEGHSHHAEHSADTHIRHCLEYIRQSLICSADTTIELAEKAGEGKVGVRGFGTQHICRDFHQLVEWTSHWEDPGTVW